jgi:rubrerythrin
VYGAPKSLRRATRRAARDEIRHARITRELAVRFGGRYVPPQVTAKPAPSLETIARENAAEGCVRETYGALIATYQAQVATDPQVRRVMREIARDETRHAALAWRIARWADKCLDPRAKQRVRAARQASIETLFGELDYQVSQSLAKVAGVPSGAQARQLAGALSSELWA